MELIRPRSEIGIQAATNADNDGYNGPRHSPIITRMATRAYAPPSSIAHGVMNDRIADKNIPPPKIYFAPNFCAITPLGNCNKM